MEAQTLKIVFIPLVLILNLLCGGVPYLLVLRRGRRSPSARVTRCLSLASCFSAGVFLATCFVGLFPSVEEKYAQLAKRTGGRARYPVPEVTVCAGFFAVWLLEQLLRRCVASCSPAAPPASPALLGAEEGEEEEAPGHGHSHLPGAGAGDSTLRGVLLTFALGSHSVLEGLGFGLMDRPAQVVNMALAIGIHEGLCALSLGLQLAAQRGRPCVAAVLLAAFALLIPVGVALGLSVEASQGSVAGQAATLVLQGMAAGTFIYVVFFEILPPETASARDSILKVLACAAGFVVIALIRLVSVGADAD